jgi:LuxR family maltose regulon positive regulatory protein
VRNPQAYSLWVLHDYFARQGRFAEAHGLIGWLIEFWIVEALLYHVEGKVEDARRTIQSALEAAAPQGYLRLFLDEADLLRPLLESVQRHSKDSGLATYVRHLLDAMPREPISARARLIAEEKLSDREIDVLRLLAAGQSYKEIGQGLFLSLNTVQFHVKSIYRKLSVNKRLEAIEKAREMNLI